MLRQLCVWAVLTLTLAGCATAPEIPDNAGKSALTPKQVEMYIRSYEQTQAMARKYWGKRRYTKPHKILPSQGTFGRAFKEMEAAGKLHELDELVQTYSFENHEVWMKVANRITFAYMWMRLEERDPVQAKLKWQRLKAQLRGIANHRKSLEKLPPYSRKKRLAGMDQVQQQAERDMMGKRDMPALLANKAAFEELEIRARKAERRK